MTEPRTIQMEMDPALLQFLESGRPVEESLRELQENPVDLEHDSEFVAGCMIDQFLNAAFAKMQETGISRSDLARKLGKSRQYVSRVLNETSNFTLETMAEFCCALDLQPRLVFSPPEPVKASRKRQKKVTQPSAEVPRINGRRG